MMKLEATKLRKGWAIHPAGALGTCGWIDGISWTVKYVSHKPNHIPERDES
jgi:hypothetical protein